MGKDNKNNWLNKIVKNAYVRNIGLMGIIAIVLVLMTLFVLKIYTRHNDTVEVPELKSLQIQNIASIVASANLKYEVIDSVYSKNGVPGSILEQIPKGKSFVKEGRTIYLTVQSFNEPLVAIPDLVDASLRQSQTLLQTLGFTNIKIDYIPSEYAGLVYAVEYKGAKLKAGQKVPKGSPLTLKVGSGNATEIAEDSLTNTTVIEGETPQL
ncbi:MAG: hypothetical protein RL662_2083 [Bacteroidota bacterium]|jgi:beta-lactam-binding protein with PASTA domain